MLKVTNDCCMNINLISVVMFMLRIIVNFEGYIY